MCSNAADVSADTTSLTHTVPLIATARADTNSVEPAAKKGRTAGTALTSDKVAVGKAGSPINLDTASDAAESGGRRITSGMLLSNVSACR